MQPTLHKSDAWSYYFSIMAISGARYHLEPTCTEMDLFYLYLLTRSLCNNSAMNTLDFASVSSLFDLSAFLAIFFRMKFLTYYVFMFDKSK